MSELKLATAGSTLGTQSLLERLKGPLSQLAEHAFWKTQGELIESGLPREAIVPQEELWG